MGKKWKNNRITFGLEWRKKIDFAWIKSVQEMLSFSAWTRKKIFELYTNRIFMITTNAFLLRDNVPSCWRPESCGDYLSFTVEASIWLIGSLPLCKSSHSLLFSESKLKKLNCDSPSACFISIAIRSDLASTKRVKRRGKKRASSRDFTGRVRPA